MAAGYTPRGHYFEEFSVGDTFTSAARTVTEADIVNFAGLTGDFTLLHTDAEYARQSIYGQRVAHGLLGLSIASGLMAQSGLLEGTIMAFRELSWKFSLPVFIGDTIHAQSRVSEVKPLRRMGGGAVMFEVEVVNQDGKTVQSGQWMVLVAAKP